MNAEQAMKSMTFLTALEHAQSRYPEQRILQIIYNALDAKGHARQPDGRPSDLFYVTDDTLLEALLAYNQHE